MISSSSIDEIRDKADLLTLVQEYVPLKKRGKNYVGLCPFHQEKTPSFTVSPEKQLFHCFGCGEGGNVFAFLMKIEKLDFVESVEKLGAKLGVEIKQTKTAGPDKSLKEKFYDILTTAVRFYQQNLRDGAKGKEYLKKRGIDEKTIETFKLGLALDDWEGLYRYLTSRGFLPSDLEKAGLIIKRESGEGFYDRFRNRIIFPIFNREGREIGLGGRTLENAEPKYINSTDSPIYLKGDTLYGLNFSKDEIRKSGTAILVEGYLDLITGHQFGVQNLVAPLGTALTSNQARLLSRYSQTVILAFDTDLAGGAATERSVEILREAGLMVKVAVPEEAKDPDEFIRAKGVEAFIKLIQEAVSWLEYKINLVLGRHNLKVVEEKVRAIKEVAGLLALEKDRLIRSEYIKNLAGRLKVSEESILSEVGRLIYYQGKVDSKKKVEKPESKISKAERILLNLSIEDPEFLKTFKDNLNPSEFSVLDHQKIAELLLEIVAEENLSHFLLENLPLEETKKVLSKILVEEVPEGDRLRIFNDCLNTLKAQHLRIKLENLRSQIGEAERVKELGRLSELNREFAESSTLLRSYLKL